MKIVFYSPYLPKHFGGGEKYLFDVALVYAQKHQVFIALPYQYQNQDLILLKKEYEAFLGYSLKDLIFVSSPFGAQNKALRKILWTTGFDVLYYVTDGSAFFSLARRNIMHIQIPLTLKKTSFWQKIKFNCFKIINTNSYFTKKVVEKYWGLKVNLVCQPSIDLKEFTNQAPKEKIILHVGRFFENLHCKNQDLLVQFFKNLRVQDPKALHNWRLVMIGKIEDKTYFNKVKKLARDLPIEILSDASREQLLDYYQRASIYWHATGFNADEKRQPEKMEHFGISTVEAMAGGCVPIVIGKGGQKEILGQQLKSCLWLTEAECLDKTLKLIKDKKQLIALSQISRQRAGKFSHANFARQQWKLLQ